jgi:hypothetical protein
MENKINNKAKMRIKLFFIQLLFILSSPLSADIISHVPVIHDEGRLYIFFVLLSSIATIFSLLAILFLMIWRVYKMNSNKKLENRCIVILTISIIAIIFGIALFAARGFHWEEHRPIHHPLGPDWERFDFYNPDFKN